MLVVARRRRHARPSGERGRGRPRGRRRPEAARHREDARRARHHAARAAIHHSPPARALPAVRPPVAALFRAQLSCDRHFWRRTHATLGDRRRRTRRRRVHRSQRRCHLSSILGVALPPRLDTGIASPAQGASPKCTYGDTGRGTRERVSRQRDLLRFCFEGGGSHTSLAASTSMSFDLNGAAQGHGLSHDEAPLPPHVGHPGGPPISRRRRRRRRRGRAARCSRGMLRRGVKPPASARGALRSVSASSSPRRAGALDLARDARGTQRALQRASHLLGRRRSTRATRCPNTQWRCSIRPERAMPRARAPRPRLDRRRGLRVAAPPGGAAWRGARPVFQQIVAPVAPVATMRSRACSEDDGATCETRFGDRFRDASAAMRRAPKSCSACVRRRHCGGSC